MKTQTPEPLAQSSIPPTTPTLEAWLAAWEQHYETWRDYYHCCGRY